MINKVSIPVGERPNVSEYFTRPGVLLEGSLCVEAGTLEECVQAPGDGPTLIMPAPNVTQREVFTFDIQASHKINA